MGAGSAGAPLAASLAEQNPTKSILLVDAGPSNQQFRVLSPFVALTKLQNSDLDFAYRTAPQELQQNRQSFWPRGKCLGGSSSLNFMLAVRGDRRGYETWANELGCPGWGWTDVEPYFVALEDYKSDKRKVLHRGKHGAVGVTDMRDVDFVTKKIAEAFVTACGEVGLPLLDDYNGPVQTGAGLSQVSIKDGKRHDTASAFLFSEHGAFAKCPNLHCLTEEQCARVIMDESQSPPRACAVEFISGLRIKAKREILLSAGAVGSAQILLLSGIGPKAHLESKKVKCVVDLPGVGRNLKDHLFMAHGYHIKDEWAEHTFNAKSPIQVGTALARLFILNNGLFTTTWVQAMAFKDSAEQKKEHASAIQIHFVPFFNHDEEATKTNFGFDRAIHEMGTANDIPKQGIIFLPSLIQPKSSGMIELVSNNPRDHPHIDPRYMTHPDDVKVFVEAVQFCDQLVAKSKALGSMCTRPSIDDSIKHPYGSYEYIEAKVKRDCITVYHPTSSCKMGPDNDPMAVLDPKLRVRGVKGLRVIDCASMPDIPAGNTNFPAIMLGLKGADIVTAEARVVQG